MFNSLKETLRGRVAEYQNRKAIREEEDLTLAIELDKFLRHNLPLIFKGIPLAGLLYPPEVLSGELTTLQLGFHEHGKSVIQRVLYDLTLTGFIFNPDRVYRDFYRERNFKDFALKLNDVFELRVNSYADAFGKATYITIAPIGEEPPEGLDIVRL